MSIAAGTRQRDVDSTFFALIRDRFEIGVNVGKVRYNDLLADPTAFSVWWVEVRSVIQGCRQGLASIYRIDIVYEVGDQSDQATRDRTGRKATDKADEFLELVIPDNDVGFRIYDYAVPAAPVITGWCGRVIDDIGAMGEANNRQMLFDEQKGLVRVLMDLPVKHAIDLIRLPLYR